MADYQRFVSYLYEYKNNIKSKNCGFCRVELRDHNCRLEVHLKLPFYPFTPTLRVYVFVPSNEKLYGIFLGNASYQQGNVSGTFSFSEKNMNNSTYQFSQLGGVMIQTDSGLCFASAWKDLNIHPESFIFPENKSSEQKISDKECKPEVSFPNSTSEITVVQSTTESDQPKVETLSAISDEAKNISDVASKLSENETVTQERETHKSEITVQHEDSNETEKDTQKNDSETIQKEVITSNEPEPALLAASTDSDHKDKEIPKPENIWEHILKSYPQCHPFFDDEIHNCVQLTQKDVQKISSLGFPIYNNPFFRHNCQSFQHFLIGEISCSSSVEKTQYILAVPGLYNSKEQYMASMFGFPYFKRGQNSRFNNNCWGYWYRILPEHWCDCRF